MHLTRYYGAYSNRSRRLWREGEEGAERVSVRIVEEDRAPPGRASWARLLRRVFEVDPLTCPACGTGMKIVSVITTPSVIGAILRHLRKTGNEDLWAARAPPAA